jgi:hypothetical protein
MLLDAESSGCTIGGPATIGAIYNFHEDMEILNEQANFLWSGVGTNQDHISRNRIGWRNEALYVQRSGPTHHSAHPSDDTKSARRIHARELHSAITQVVSKAELSSAQMSWI